MSKFILLADTHLNDDSIENLNYGIRLLDDCGEIAKKHRCKSVIVAGDFLHHRFRYSQELLLAIYKCLGKWQDKGINFIILRGNHDSPNQDEGSPDLEKSILHIFNKVSTIILKPKMIESEDCVICLLPWYPPEQYRKLLQHYASLAVGYDKPRILISHVSLQEGKVSPSNTKITTPIRVSDLIPEAWTGGVYLGDYHNSSQVGTRKEWDVRYLGAPRCFTFGDFNTVGVWELSVSGNHTRIVPIPLISRFPSFHSHQVNSLEDLPLRDYDNRDKHRCYVTLELRNHVLSLYPGIKPLPIETAPVTGTGRLEQSSKLSTLQIAAKWMKGKGLKKEYVAWIRYYLGTEK